MASAVPDTSDLQLNFFSLVALAALQAAAWWRLLDPGGGLLSPLVAWVKRDRRRHSNVVANMVHDVAAFKLDDRSQMVDYFAQLHVGAALHHTCAALCASLGYWWGSPILFRLGLSFEIGEDVLHYLQMAVSALSPPGEGPKPWASCPKTVWAYIALHHIIGLCAGSGAFLYCADWPEAQLYVALLLACVLPCHFKIPVFVASPPSDKPSLGGQVVAGIDIVSLVAMLYARFHVGIPLAIQLAQRAGEEIGPAAGRMFGVFILGVAPVFFTASIVLHVQGMVANIRKQCGVGTAP